MYTAFQVGPLSFETIVNKYGRVSFEEPKFKTTNDRTTNRKMKLIEPTNFHIVDQPINAIDVIREKEKIGDVDDDAFYICNVSDIIEKYRNWQKHMPRIIPFYAVKCNDDAVPVQVLAALGAGFDCASKGEIAQVLSYGVSPEAIIYAHPMKQVSHLNFAAEMNVTVMTVDSDFEMQKIAKHYPNARLVLRIRADAAYSVFPLGEKFGCNADTEGPELIRLAHSLGLNMIGISFHVGSESEDPPAYARGIKAARKLFDFAKTIGYDFKLLDIGGGFPGEIGTDIAEIASIVNSTIDLCFPSPDVTIIAEPGRYFVSSAYTLACPIHSKRNVYQNGQFLSSMYYISDGVYGTLADFLYKKLVGSNKIPPPLTLKPATEEMVNCTIWGPTCDAVDLLFENISLPRLNIGDLIMFENMGAYTLTLACDFNGFTSPRIEYYCTHKDLEEINATTLASPEHI